MRGSRNQRLQVRSAAVVAHHVIGIPPDADEEFIDLAAVRAFIFANGHRFIRAKALFPRLPAGSYHNATLIHVDLQSSEATETIEPKFSH